jgi:hypothetical protein
MHRLPVGSWSQNEPRMSRGCASRVLVAMQIDRRAWFWGIAAFGIVVSGFAACAPDPLPPSRTATTTTTMIAACTADRRLGGFEVQYDAETRSVSGHLAERPEPTASEALVLQIGECRILRRSNPFCDPPCGPGTICAATGSCVVEPKNLNLGTVTIAGLKKDVRMEPRLPSNEYFDSELPDELYEPGSEIRLEASGSNEVKSFQLRSTGVPPLTITTTDWTLAPGQGLPIAWPPGNDPNTRVLVRVSVDQHGNSPVVLTCDLPDNGSVMLDGPLVDELLGYGVSGYPSALITRRAVVAAEVAAGCGDLQIISVSNHTLKVAGHTPCKRTSDCPSGKRCDVVKESCR